MSFLPSQPRLAILAAAMALFSGVAARATPLLVIDARSGEVLVERDATQPWYPASLTKLVTVYAALTAVREGRITMDTPMRVSARAARMPPSKMGFKPGQEVTLDNALKMLMVKSANDLAITIAEGVAGSVENFAVQMNTVAARVGMRESHFVNPNGLHDANHYSSARDMALVAMALYRDFPQYANLYGIGAFRLGSMVVPTHNGLLGRYPGAEGMKTGFTCPAGFNVVASATHGGRRLIAVVLGFPNAKSRTIEAASIMDAGFATSGSGRNVAALPATGGGPPNMREQICGAHRQELAEDDFAVRVAGAAPPSTHEDDSPAAFFRNDGRAAGSPVDVGGVAATQMALAQRPIFEPIDVYVGRAPGWTGPVAGPGGAPDKVAAAEAAEKPPARKTARAHAKPAAHKQVVTEKPKGKSGAKGKGEPKKVAAHAAGGKTSKKTTE